MDLVLKKIVVQIPFKSACKGNGRGRPIHRIRKLHSCPGSNWLRVLRGEVDVDDMVSIVGDVECLVGVDEEVGLGIALLWRGSNKAPDREIVHEEFIPIMSHYSLSKHPCIVV